MIFNMLKVHDFYLLEVTVENIGYNVCVCVDQTQCN
jgi:hypothetical protein